ncbi:MAG: glycerol dehydrogenase [Oscillospiraceae bacterium]|nr:glycerol dehydrogenase [Oscillospiraceae bacterium]
MKKAMKFPRKYVQGRGIVNEIGSFASVFGKKALVIWGSRTKEAVGEAILTSLKAEGVEVTDVKFCGECTKAEANRVAALAKDSGSDSVISIGGGKVIDVAKGVAVYAGLPNIVVPTIASNDAPTSACTVWYDENGGFIGSDTWPFNPDIVLVDTEVIVRAPVRMLIAGIGDAIVTWFEANANYQSHKKVSAGGTATNAALMLARLCHDTLREFALPAIEAVKIHAVTPAVENVIEANILLSGIGWESGGVATAHGVGNALSLIPEAHDFMHGEKVSFGLVTQLCLDGSLSDKQVNETAEFLVNCGLPTTFEDINIHTLSSERLREFAQEVAAESSPVHNHNFPVTVDDVYDAMLMADALGKKTKRILEK